MSWVKLGQDIDGEAANDWSGHSVSLSSNGTIVAIGAHTNDGAGSNSGHVRVYQYNTSTSLWVKLGQDIDGEAANDQIGHSVSLSSDGTIVAIGAIENDGAGSNSGHVRVYQYNTSTSLWVKLGQDIDGEAANDKSGFSVSLNSDGTIVAIGAVENDGAGSNSGHVRVYQYNTSTSLWVKLGQDIDGEAASDQSGRSVSLNSDGTIVAIGAFENDGAGSNSGHVRVYQYNTITSLWVKLGQDIDGEAASDKSGHSVSLSSDGTIVAIGAVENDGAGSNSGHVRVYQYNTSTSLWVKLGQDIDGEAAINQSGRSVSLNSNGTILAIGANYNWGINGNFSGHVRVYKYNTSTSLWVKLGQDIDGEAADDHYGWSVSLSSNGTIVAIGAVGNDGNGAFSGHVRAYQYIRQPASELKALGYTASQLKALDYTATELKTAGFTTSELKAAGYTATELKAASFTAAQLKVASFTATELKTAGFTATELKTAGFTATELKTAGFTASELKAALFTATQLKSALFTATQLKNASFTASELKTAGFTVSELIGADFPVLNLTTTKILNSYNSGLPIIVRLTHSREDLSVLANIFDNNYTTSSGVAYSLNTGYAGVVSKFSVTATNTTNSQNEADFSSEHINVEIDLPMANTAHSPLKLFKINPSNNQKIINSDYPVSGRNLTYNSITGKWETTLPSLSTFIIVDPSAPSGGAGGDPHIQTIHREHHLLPNDWKLVKLYEHNDMKVIVKCEHINDEVIEQLHKFDERRNIISINKNIHKYVTDLTYMTELAVLKHNEEVFKIDLLNDKVLLHNEEAVVLEKLNSENEDGLFSLTHKRIYPKQKLSSYLLHLDSNNVMKIQIDNFWDDINFVKLHLFDNDHIEEYVGEFFKHDIENRLE